MLKKVLDRGKAVGLKKEIIKLNEEVKKLEDFFQNQEEKEKKIRKKFADAWSKKQDAEAEIKKYQQKIKTLKDKIETFEKEKEKKSYLKHYWLTFSDFKNLLYKLGSIKSKNPVLITSYIPPDYRGYRENLLQFLGDEITTQIGNIDSSTGVLLFYDLERLVNVIILPQIPLERPYWKKKTNFEVKDLEKISRETLKLGIIFSRAGKSIIGLSSSPDKFETFREIKTRVARGHSKGGFSQRRFERLREKDIEHHMEKLTEIAGNELPEPDYLILSGDFKLIKKLEIKLLKKFQVPFIKFASDIPPERKNQYEILEYVWGVKVYHL